MLGSIVSFYVNHYFHVYTIVDCTIVDCIIVDCTIVDLIVL